MTVEQPQFDPHDPKYKKVEDLPKQYQRFFAESDNGFVLKQAKDHEEISDIKAMVRNQQRKFLDKLFGNNVASGADMMMEEAQIIDAIKNIEIDHDRATCTIDIEGHHVILIGHVLGDRQIQSDGSRVDRFAFAIQEGVCDGEKISADHFGDLESFFGTSILDRLKMIAVKKKIEESSGGKKK